MCYPGQLMHLGNSSTQKVVFVKTKQLIDQTCLCECKDKFTPISSFLCEFIDENGAAGPVTCMRKLLNLISMLGNGHPFVHVCIILLILLIYEAQVTMLNGKNMTQNISFRFWLNSLKHILVSFKFRNNGSKQTKILHPIRYH